MIKFKVPEQLMYKLDQLKEKVHACSDYMRLGDNKPSFILLIVHIVLLIELKYNFVVILGFFFLAVNSIQFATALHTV